MISALDGAKGGPVVEGAVGGGTGMVCLGFKGGIGTASRKLPPEQGGYTVGVLVQCNFGARRDLRIAGVPVGEEITDLQACIANHDPQPNPPGPGQRRPCDAASGHDAETMTETGSIIVVVATDAPLLPHQLKRIATRVVAGRRTLRRLRRERVRRHFHRVFDGQSRRRWSRGYDFGANALEPANVTAVQRDVRRPPKKRSSTPCSRQTP